VWGKNNPSYNRSKTSKQIESARKTGKLWLGKKHSEESKQKMRINGKGKITGEKNPNYNKKGSNNHMSKKIVIIYPSGKEVLSLCIKDFADKNNLQASNLSAVRNGKISNHKGFKAREYNESTDKNLEVWRNE